MNGKKIIFLFLALLLPGCIFLFLKIFGKNQFAVVPLFQKEAPVLWEGCPIVNVPYVVPDSMMINLMQPDDTLSIVHFSNETGWSPEAKKAFRQLSDLYENKEPVTVAKLIWNDSHQEVYRCTFAMKEPTDIALIDRRGVIHGQYNSTDRDEIDRLKTEITIILKKY